MTKFKMKFYQVVLAVVFFATAAIVGYAQDAQEFTVTSPDGLTTVNLSCSKTSLDYQLSWKGRTLTESSSLSILEQSQYQLLGSTTKTVDETWKPVWGSYSQIRDHANQLVLTLNVSGVTVDLICQVYNSGVGFRFKVPEQAGLQGKEFQHAFKYRSVGGYNAYCGTPRSSSPLGPISSASLAKPKKRSKPRLGTLPLVMELDGGGWVALLESDLFSAELFDAARFTVKPGASTIQSVATAMAQNGGFITPWKVILFGDQPGDFLTNVVALNLAAPCEITDTSWIKPGKGLWDWRIHGYDNGSFEYGIDTRSYLRQVDFCAANRIEYLTIDDQWFLSAKHGSMQVSPDVDIARVIQYAKDNGVEIMLYYDERAGKFGDELIFKHYQQLGAAGIKYGFRGNNAPFTRQAIRAAAAAKQMVFFHDGPVPMVGVERTMPNMISREYGHGQQDSRRAFTPSTFLKTAMINGLTGPLDISNGNFGINSINAGERNKGPKVKNSYVTTVVSEVARCLIINSALVTLPDAPEEYEKKADLFDILSQMPATWDDTRVPNSSMADYLTVARRSGDVWFVGTVNSEEKARELSISLDFLAPGGTYDVTFYQDAKQTDGASNPEAYEIETKQVKAGENVAIRMARGGGHAMILKPAK